MRKLFYFEFLKFYRKYGLLGIFLYVLAIGSIIGGTVVSYTFFSIISHSIKIATSGEEIDANITSMVGNYIGGVVGTIWSFAGVILFFLALRLQSKELSLQIQELKSTREVFSTQQFENTFFNLLKTQNDIKLSIDYRINNFNDYGAEIVPSILHGHSALESIKQYLHEEDEKLTKNLLTMQKVYAEKDKEKKNKNDKDFEDYYGITYTRMLKDKSLQSAAVYKLTFKKFHNQLGHYFRNLYHILLYLKESEENEIGLLVQEEITGRRLSILINDKNISVEHAKKKFKKYSNFVQAQMSATELLLLFYNCHFFPKMKKLVQYYAIVESLSSDDLLNPEIDENNFSEISDLREKISGIAFKARNEILEI